MPLNGITTLAQAVSDYNSKMMTLYKLPFSLDEAIFRKKWDLLKLSKAAVLNLWVLAYPQIKAVTLCVPPNQTCTPSRTPTLRLYQFAYPHIKIVPICVPPTLRLYP